MPQLYAVTIVLPLYNPKGDWAELLIKNMQELEAYLPAQYRLTYIVVHDGPVTDHVQSTFDVLSETFSRLRFYSYKINRGKGYALRQGVRRATTPFTVMLDFDFPYRKENIAQLLLALTEGYDMVTGKRSDQYFRQLPLKRKAISRTYSALNKLLFKLPVYDTQSGLKGFNTAGKAVFLQTHIRRFLIDTEFLLRIAKTNLKVKVIELELKPGISFTNFGTKVLATELRNLIHIIKLNQKLKEAAYKKGTVTTVTPVGPVSTSVRQTAAG